MIRRTFTLALVALLVTSLVAGVAPVAAQSDDAACEPENELTYDEFRADDGTIGDFDDTGSATVEKQNTNASLSADEAFVRLSVANANTYCVAYTIQMADSVVDAATLGSVGATDADLNADWRAIHDFEADETHTEVTVTVPGETKATFAPSTLRVKSLSWTSSMEASGFIDNARETIGFGSPPVEERTHTFTGNTSEQVTIPLTHPDNADETINSWQATYTTDDGDRTRILSNDGGDPVFYRTVDDGSAVEIVFNEPGEVEFTVEPTLRDRAGFQVDSFLSSLSDALNLPLSTTPIPEVLGP